MTTRKVTTRTVQWSAEVRKADPKTDLQDPPPVYVFGNGRRQFKDSGPNKGPYGG